MTAKSVLLRPQGMRSRARAPICPLLLCYATGRQCETGLWRDRHCR